MSVTHNDLGWKRIKAELKKAAGAGVKIGIQKGTKHNPKDGGGTVSQVQIAATHEYGDVTRGIPERSFMRSSFKENKAMLVAQTAAEYKAIVAGRKTTRTALGLLGQLHESQVKAKINSNIQPPRSPRTIAKKGSSRTLIDTKQLHDGIRYKLEVKGER
jgi:hypothetical protein